MVDNLSENTNTDLIVYDKSDMQVFDVIVLKSVRGKIDYKCSRDDTAAGYNMITVKILKCISKHIVNHLVYTYNLSISKSIFPDKFEWAIIKPLWKGRHRKTMGNYYNRPISMLTNFTF